MYESRDKTVPAKHRPYRFARQSGVDPSEDLLLKWQRYWAAIALFGTAMTRSFSFAFLYLFTTSATSRLEREIGARRILPTGLLLIIVALCSRAMLAAPDTAGRLLLGLPSWFGVDLGASLTDKIGGTTATVSAVFILIAGWLASALCKPAMAWIDHDDPRSSFVAYAFAFALLWLLVLLATKEHLDPSFLSADQTLPRLAVVVASVPCVLLGFGTALRYLGQSYSIQRLVTAIIFGVRDAIFAAGWSYALPLLLWMGLVTAWNGVARQEGSPGMREAYPVVGDGILCESPMSDPNHSLLTCRAMGVNVSSRALVVSGPWQVALLRVGPAGPSLVEFFPSNNIQSFPEAPFLLEPGKSFLLTFRVSRNQSSCDLVRALAPTGARTAEAQLTVTANGHRPLTYNLESRSILESQMQAQWRMNGDSISWPVPLGNCP